MIQATKFQNIKNFMFTKHIYTSDIILLTILSKTYL